MSNISNYAAAWKAVVPPEAYRLPGSHAAFQQQVSVMAAIQQDIDTIRNGLAGHGIQLTNLASQASGSVGSSFSGTLGVSQGGTGLSSLGSADQVLGVSHDGSALEYKSLLGTSGSIAVSDATGSISFDLAPVGAAGSFGTSSQVPAFTTDAYGRVTAVTNTAIAGVSLSAPSQFSVSGSPFAPGGSVSFSWNSQSANSGLFGPASGSAGAPAFRAMVLSDLPSFYSGVGSPSQGAVLYVGSSGNLAALAAGSTNQALLSGGASANPSWGSVVNSLAGTAHQVSVSSAVGAVVLSLPQSIDTVSSPSFSALTLSSPLAVGSGGTGLTSTSQSYAFMGPASGSGAPSWRALVASDLPFSLPSLTGSKGILYDSGANAFAVSSTVTHPGAGELQISAGTGSVALSFKPSANSLTWISGSAHSSGDHPVYLTLVDSSGNPNIQLFQNGNSATGLEVLSQTNATGANVGGYLSVGTVVGSGGSWQTNGNPLGGVHFGEFSQDSGYRIDAKFLAICSENHSATNAGTSLSVFTTPAGGTSIRNSWTFQDKGSLYPAGGVLAASSTDGFLYIPSCGGLPTGTPTSIGGAIPILFDTVHNDLYAYNGGWVRVALS